MKRFELDIQIDGVLRNFLYGGHENDCENKGIVHIIGERPESGHHNFSINTGRVDHNFSKVIWGIFHTSVTLEWAITSTMAILNQLFTVIKNTADKSCKT